MNKPKINSSDISTKTNKRTKAKIPAWMDCAWRRLPCEKKECPLCSQVAKDRKKHLSRGEDPDAVSVALEDVGNYFKNTLKAIRKSAKENGIDLLSAKKMKEPPEPRVFPLYHRVNNWRDGVQEIAEDSDDVSSAWLFTDAGEDLLWYANTLAAKTYRQLTNRWHMDNGSDYGDFDLEYTRYVLDECLQLLKTALGELLEMETTQHGQFMIARLSLFGLEQELAELDID